MTVNGAMYNERELVENVSLCDSNGSLNPDCIGWSRRPVFDCNLSGHPLRKKKWNYWCITSPECLFSITISNIDYAGLVFAYYLDFKTKKFIEKTIMVPFGKGCNMPQTVNETVSFKHRDMEVVFLNKEGYTLITVSCKNFNDVSLDAEFKVLYPDDHETLNVVIPWSEKRFQFTSKQECLPVDGGLTVGDMAYSFRPGSTFACLDYGRGVWPFRVKWNWANASGMIDGRRIGLNLGGKWTDGTGMTENCLVVDGRITKLSEDIIFEYDTSEFMKPWILKTAVTDRVDLIFTPIYDRIANMNLLLIKSEIHQLIGHFSGTIKTDAGETIVLENIPGCSEDHFGQW